MQHIDTIHKLIRVSENTTAQLKAVLRDLTRDQRKARAENNKKLVTKYRTKL